MTMDYDNDIAYWEDRSDLVGQKVVEANSSFIRFEGGGYIDMRRLRNNCVAGSGLLSGDQDQTAKEATDDEV